ncbi:MAG: response regulator [Betaproteobacteria bacterium]|nr:response regulator [Betaproteobacteria bacterium]
MMRASDEKKVILSIDDIPANLIAIKNILYPLFDVRLVKEGGQALALLKREKIDLVLLDIEMPGHNGFELLQVIRQEPALAHLPVIFVTTHASASFIRRAVKAGANGYILKPFKPSLLLQKVLEQLGMDIPTAYQDNTCAL